jgi:hypothetical protein
MLLDVWGVSTAHADLSSVERATAEALFQRGVALMEGGSYGEACAAFTATLELEKGLGTMLRLADCYDHQGKTASAWALFKEVAASASITSDVVREQIANQRVSELESRLSLLKLNVEAASSPPVGPNERHEPVPQITIAGVVIAEPMWNAAFPIDPGAHAIVASAPGYETWSGTVEIPEGPTLEDFLVPTLDPVVVVPQHDNDVFATRHGLQTDNPSPPPGKISRHPPGAAQTSGFRPLGYTTTIVGVIALAAAGYLTYQAHSHNQESRAACQPDDPNACTPHGVDLRKEAQWFADAATATGAGGGLLTAAGLSIIVFAPHTAQSSNQRGLAPLSVGLTGTW